MARTPVRGGTPSGVIVINKKPWAVGFLWATANSAAEARRLALQRAGKSYTTAVFRTARDGSHQFGLGNEVKGHKRGVPSLAAAFADKLETTFFAAFMLDAERYYCIACRNGVINPQTDVIVARDAVADLYDTLVPELGDDHALTMPEGLDYDRAERFTLEYTTANILKPTAKVGPLNRSAATRALVTRAFVGVAGLGAAYYLYLYLSTPSGEVVPPQTMEVPAQPWANREYGTEAANLCLDAMERMPSGGPGWTRQSMACQDGSVSGIYARDKPLNAGGTPVDWFRIMLRDGGWPTAGLGAVEKSDKITYTMPVPVARDAWSVKLKPPALAKQLGVIAGRFDKAFLPIVTTNQDDKFYATRTLTFHTAYAPRSEIKLFDGILGLTLGSMTQTQNGYDTALLLYQQERLPEGYFIDLKRPPALRTFDPNYAGVYAPKREDEP